VLNSSKVVSAELSTAVVIVTAVCCVMVQPVPKKIIADKNINTVINAKLLFIVPLPLHDYFYTCTCFVYVIFY